MERQQPLVRVRATAIVRGVRLLRRDRLSETKTVAEVQSPVRLPLLQIAVPEHA